MYLLALVASVALLLVFYHSGFGGDLMPGADLLPLPWTSEPLTACVQPGTYAPAGPGICVMRADGAVEVVPGAPTPPQVAWDPFECEATMLRVAPWLHQPRRDLVEAPPLFCRTKGTTYTQAPLFLVAKHSRSYSVTEPVWASLHTTQDARKRSPPAAVGGCPALYVTTLTEGFIQTFNQLQGIVNTLWLAAKINRTMVLPPLNEISDGRPEEHYDAEGTAHVPFEGYFDVTRLRQAGYCVVSYSEFERDVRQRWPHEAERTLVFYGDHRSHFITRHIDNDNIDVAPRLAPPSASGPPARLAFRFTAGEISSVLPNHQEAPTRRPSEPLMVLECLHSHLLRLPMDEALRIYARLDPADGVAQHVRQLLRRADGGKPTLTLHLRNREGECRTEQQFFNRYTPPNNSISPFDIVRSNESKREIIAECDYTAQATMRSVRYALQHMRAGANHATNVSIYIASDNQRPQEIEKLTYFFQLSRYALLVNDVRAPPAYATPFAQKVFSVVVDYFAMVHADVFYGNRFSSISQSACAARLGSGLACHGVPTGFLRGIFFPHT